MSKLTKPAQKQIISGMNPKEKKIYRSPEGLKTMNIRKRIEEIEEQKKSGIRNGDNELKRPL